MSQLPRLKSRHRAKRPVSMLAAGGGLQLAAAGGAAGVAPTLVMPQPDERKSSIISGSVTTLVHVAVFGSLFVLAWLAPPIEQLIPVRIIRELPGTNAEPAPARKILKPRQQRKVQAARQVTAQAVQQPRVMKMSAEQLKMNKLRKAAAPQAVQRRQVASQRVQARSIDTRVFNANVDLSKLTNVTTPTDMNAPVVDYDGPREVNQGSAVMMPENFAAVPQIDTTEYSSAAPLQIESSEPMPDDLEAFEFDTDVGIYAGGEGTGGTGTAVGTVRCLESAYVLRYLDLVKVRTQKRWQVPEDAPNDSSVKLRFALDASGTATRVEFVGSTVASLGNSAVAALRSASPFPPMDDNVRCLAGKGLTGTFFRDNL
jgi:TonB family protein